MFRHSDVQPPGERQPSTRHARLARGARTILIALVLVLGIWLGGHPDVLPQPVAEALVDDEARVLAAAINKIDDRYIDEVSSGPLVDAAIAGAVRELDDGSPRTSPPASTSAFRSQPWALSGCRDHRPRSRRGTARTARAGGLAGRACRHPARRRHHRRRRAAARGQVARRGERADQGPAGTRVRLRIRRDRRTLTKHVERATISPPVVTRTARRAGGERIAHIRLSTFSSGAHEQLADAIGDARERGAQGIVFDLRGNGGGLVKEAQLVASEFLQRGEIVTTRGRGVPGRTLSAVGEPAAGVQRWESDERREPPYRSHGCCVGADLAVAHRGR